MVYLYHIFESIPFVNNGIVIWSPQDIPFLPSYGVSTILTHAQVVDNINNNNIEMNKLLDNKYY
jgi:hypothetical protein